MAQVVHKAWQPKFLAPPPVYLDASVTVAVLTPHDRLHARAAAFWADHIVAQHELQVSLLTLDETIFHLVRGLVAGAMGLHPNQIKLSSLLKQRRGMLAAHEQNVRLALAYLLAWVTVVDGRPSTPRAILDSWLDRFAQIDGVHDALHLGLAEHSGARSLATGDSDFLGIRSFPTPLHVVKL